MAFAPPTPGRADARTGAGVVAASAVPVTVVPASVSAAVSDLVGGPPARGRVLAAFPAAVYVTLDRDDADLLAVVTSDAARPPNALVLAAPAAAGPFSGIRARDRAVVGGGELRVGGLCVSAARTWTPAPRLPPTGRTALATAVVAGGRVLRDCCRPPGLDPETFLRPLTRAAGAGDAVRAVAAAGRMLGRGPGLTPSGDDMLAGFLVALRLLPGTLSGTPPGPLPGAPPGAGSIAGKSVGALADVADHLAGFVGGFASARTTTLSAALLRHAGRGEPSAEAADLLRGLTGAAPLDGAVRRLLTVGATSGPDLAYGLLAGALAVVRAVEPAGQHTDRNERSRRD